MEEEIHCTLMAGRHPGMPELCVYPDAEWHVSADGLHALEEAAQAFTDEYATAKLVVYITGFTPALTSLMKVCAADSIELDVMHYDRESGSYVRQRVLS